MSTQLTNKNPRPPLADAIGSARKFICVHHNGETYVTYAHSKTEAAEECGERSAYAKPWMVLAYPQNH